MLIHPAEARCESANNIQAPVRPDNRLESQGPIDQIAGPLGTDSTRSHEIKVDKNYRLLNSDESHGFLDCVVSDSKTACRFSNCETDAHYNLVRFLPLPPSKAIWRYRGVEPMMVSVIGFREGSGTISQPSTCLLKAMGFFNVSTMQCSTRMDIESLGVLERTTQAVCSKVKSMADISSKIRIIS